MPGPRDPRDPGRGGNPGQPGALADPFPRDLARYLAASTGLPQPTAVRVVADMATYFSETVEEFVRRRHIELRQRQRKNHEIWPQFDVTPADELQTVSLKYVA